jgi:hypothetical protein
VLAFNCSKEELWIRILPNLCELFSGGSPPV